MSLITIRARIRPEHEAELRQSVSAMFEALERDEPQNLKYLSLHLDDGDYLIVLDIEDGTQNPLPSMPTFQRFQEGLRAWVSEPAVAIPAQIVGSYRAL